MAWFLITELGVAVIPPSELCTLEKQKVAQGWMRSTCCKGDGVLETAKERLRGFRRYIKE